MNPEKQTVRYRGRVINVTTDEVVLPNGHRTVLEVVHHPGGAAVVAIDSQRRVCLLRQYRYVAQGWLWELPAGKLEPNEPPLATAQRELLEEAGVSGRQWESLGTALSSPGVFSEVLHLFFATDLEPHAAAHEHAEVIEVHWVPFEEAYRWAVSGRIRDAKTSIGLVRAFNIDAVRSSGGSPDSLLGERKPHEKS
jgi:ADP-ribose pyrophosphatase